MCIVQITTKSTYSVRCTAINYNHKEVDTRVYIMSHKIKLQSELNVSATSLYIVVTEKNIAQLPTYIN